MHSLYGRLSATYLLVLLLFVVGSVYLTISTAQRFLEESAQELNRALAQSLAAVIEPYLGEPVDLPEIEHAMGALMGFNPWVEIYLLDEAGNIITYKADPGAILRPRVSLEPIEAFLRGDARFPLHGVDPKRASGGKIFSAAPVQVGDRSGYLYVVLHGREYDTVAGLLAGHYILRGAAANLALLFVFAALTGLILFAVLTRRFRRMTRIVQSIAGGKLDERIETDSDDEVGVLARSVNKMADELQANLVALQRRDDLRREFIANITHDLRSPLTSIQGYVETAIIKNDSLSDQERLEFLNIIQEETVGLNALVTQLLELSKLDASEAAPVYEEFHPSELVQDVLVKFKPQADRLGIRLQTVQDESLPRVRADIRMIERVLTNLVENSLRYTPAGGEVAVCSMVENGHVRVSVSDTGLGIPPEELGRVTDRFYKGRGGAGRMSGGTGLGLSIVSRILDLHHASLLLRSEPGLGTEASFELRRA